jgi:hypothetical protein
MAGRLSQNGNEIMKENQKWNGTVDGLDGRSEGNGQNGKEGDNGLNRNETGAHENGDERRENQIGRIKERGEAGSKRREGGGQWPQSQCHPQAICENLKVQICLNTLSIPFIYFRVPIVANALQIGSAMGSVFVRHQKAFAHKIAQILAALSASVWPIILKWIQFVNVQQIVDWIPIPANALVNN